MGDRPDPNDFSLCCYGNSEIFVLPFLRFFFFFFNVSLSSQLWGSGKFKDTITTFLWIYFTGESFLLYWSWWQSAFYWVKMTLWALVSHRGSFLPEPLWIPFILAVYIHFLRPQGHAAITVEIKAVMSTDIGPLLLQLSVLRLQELWKTWFGPFGPSKRRRKFILYLTLCRLTFQKYIILLSYIWNNIFKASPVWGGIEVTFNKMYVTLHPHQNKHLLSC